MFKKISVLIILVALFVSTASSAQLKIYYIRHAESGQNAKKVWKNRPTSEWPSYVGNPNKFTPKGDWQRTNVVKKLRKSNFDFIAVSPLFRTRNTILPYLKKKGAKAEIWPELEELSQNSHIIDVLPAPEVKIIGEGELIKLPSEELPYFTFRENEIHQIKLPKHSKNKLKRAAIAKHVIQKALDIIKERFSGTNKSILLVGHGSSGMGVLRMLTNNELKDFPSINNTGIWMVEEQKNGEFDLKIYNDVPFTFIH